MMNVAEVDPNEFYELTEDNAESPEQESIFYKFCEFCRFGKIEPNDLKLCEVLCTNKDSIFHDLRMQRMDACPKWDRGDDGI
jgi:hypothetical protein